MFTNFFKVVSTKKKKKAVDTKGYVQIEGGLFFERLDDAYLNSPTATMCILKFSEYCIPAGLLPEYVDLWNKIRSDYIKYGYYLLNVTYDIDANVTGYIYKNPKHFLIKDKDDNDNASTFININSGATYPTFNKNKEIVKAQFVDTDGGFKKYLGQIYMYNDTSMPYRITPFYSVQKWMESENDQATYVSKASDNAMFGNNIFVIKASSDATPEEKEVMTEVKSALSSAKGVEEASQNLLIEWKGDTEDVSKLLSKVSISNDVDMDLLNGTGATAESKICIACYNFPHLLLFQDSGVFGNSGESIRVATEEWQKTCLKQADKILEGFAQIGIPITKQITPDNGSTNNPDPSGA